MSTPHEPPQLPPSWRNALLQVRSAALDSAPTPSCLDEFAFAAVLDGAATPGQIEHVAGCATCRSELSALLSLAGDANVTPLLRTGEAGSDARKLSRRFRVAVRGVVAVAAVAALVIAAPALVHRWDTVHRGPTISAATVPTPLFPVGDVAAIDTFRWRAVAGATRYRISLFDALGGLLLQDETHSALLAVPDSVVLHSNVSYLWRVEAQTIPGRWTASDLIEFRRTGTDPAPHSSGPAVDSLASHLGALSDSMLTSLARRDPPAYRNGLADVLAAAVHRPATDRDSVLRLAHRLASVYAAAWHDPFLPGQVARFAAATPAQQAAKITADSLRRDGIARFSRDGANAALVVWRRALVQATNAGDTAGEAAALGNIGVALERAGAIDGADSALTSAYHFAAAIGDLPVEANAIGELAGISEARHDPATARQRYADAIVLRGRIGDRRGIAADSNNLGGLARDAGDYAGARRDLEAALAINRADGRDDVAATNLVNLAALAALTGDFARADRLYRDAIAVWRARDASADLADALHGLGSLRARRGDYPGAARALEEALQIYRRTDAAVDAVAVEQLLASVLASEGDLQGAIGTLRDADRSAAAPGVPSVARATIALAQADLAAQLNLRPQSARFYQHAQQLFAHASDRRGVGEATQGLGMLRAEEDDRGGALAALNAALVTETALGDGRAMALTRFWLADLAFRSGDTIGASRQLAQATAGLKEQHDDVATAAALGESAALELAARHAVTAESLYRAALSQLADRVAPAVSWRLHAGLAAARAARGAPADADREYRASIADIERGSRSLTLPERRSMFRSDKWDVYTQLALLQVQRHDAAAGFDASERGRASEMREMLAAGQIAAPDDTSAALVVREQDLRHRIDDLTVALEGPSGGDRFFRGVDVSGSGDATRDALLGSQEAYDDLILEIREQAPRHAALVAGEAASWRSVARSLAPGQVMIEYLLGDSTSIAFVIRHDTIASIALPVARRDIARLVDFARGTLTPRGSPRLDSLWRAPLRQLDRDLVAPIAASGLLSGARNLVIVPHAELNYLPFAALLDDGAPSHFLVERFAIETTPSASVWLALGDRPKPRPTRGLLAMIPVPDALPASADEARAIARAVALEPRIVMGSAATEALFRREAPASRIIHLATYGVLNKQNPLFSFIDLRPDSVYDGRLEAHEVFGLRLNAELVVLSACQTALASGAVTDVPAGDDWIGLARAFLSAGAQRVVASLWPVQDRATATLMAEFYRHYAETRDAADALTAAQRAMIATPGTASPYLWAGFELVGGR